MDKAADPLAWRKSKRCDTASCVEVALVGNGAAVRDSKQNDGPVLHFGPEAWKSLIDGLQKGDLTYRS